MHTRLRREFTTADVELLRSVAGLVAGAIENARLHRRLAEREEALERFAERTVEWQEHERRRLAGEIHDGISQRIVSLFFHLSAAADAIRGGPRGRRGEVALAQELATAALDETRSAIAGLRPPVLDDLGLAASLESLGHSFPSWTCGSRPTPVRMAEHVETAVYRTAQEALQNVAKHAGASHVRIRLYLQRDKMVLEVTDDGAGFDPAAPGEAAAGPGTAGPDRVRPGRHARAGGTARREAGAVVGSCPRDHSAAGAAVHLSYPATGRRPGLSPPPPASTVQALGPAAVWSSAATAPPNLAA